MAKTSLPEKSSEKKSPVKTAKNGKVQFEFSTPGALPRCGKNVDNSVETVEYLGFLGVFRHLVFHISNTQLCGKLDLDSPYPTEINREFALLAL